MKRMKLKSKSKFNMWQLLLFMIMLYLSLSYFYKDIEFKNNNEDFINNLLKQSNSHFYNVQEEHNVISEFINEINNIKLSEPISIIDKVFAYEQIDENIETQNFFYAQNLVIDVPRVYIYSTHDKEGYVGDKIEGYDLDPGVVLASILLQEKLNAKGIMTIVEERRATEYIKEHNLDYPDTYKATRLYLKEMLEKHDTFDLVIDLHRDAIPKSVSTTTIDGKDYAKIMFVMNKNYSNLQFAQKFNNILNNKYPTISRGIYDKFRDTFNQDLHEKNVLIELGTNYNTFEEVMNSIDALANTIEELLNEES